VKLAIIYLNILIPSEPPVTRAQLPLPYLWIKFYFLKDKIELNNNIKELDTIKNLIDILGMLNMTKTI
jgi:hypothetical protein